MVSLDFLTLYIVIFLNGLAVSVVWAAFAYKYYPNLVSRDLFIANFLSLIGGAVLIIQGNKGQLVPAIVGNTIIIFGFCHYVMGMRRSNGQKPGILAAVFFTASMTFLMIAFHNDDRARSIVYALGQAIVMISSVYYLLSYRPVLLGAYIAAVAFFCASLGQLMVIIGNIGVITGVLSFSVFYQLASYSLVTTIFCATVWNLGLVIQMVDRLHDNLHQLSETDELTGIANRRALGKYLKHAQLLHANSGIPYSVIVADLDQFKTLNDTYGHSGGDTALRSFANVLSAFAKADDLVARSGGDEFCMVLAGATYEEARQAALKFKNHLAETEIDMCDHSVILSASIGIAQSREGLSAEDVLSLADTNLYKDKAGLYKIF